MTKPKGSTQASNDTRYDTKNASGPAHRTNKKLIKAGLLRGGIPFIVMSIMSLLILVGGSRSDARSMLYAAVLVASVSGFTVLYDIASWSLLKQSVVHFLSMALTQLPILFLAGWFPTNGLQDVLVILGVFLAIGVVLWSVGYVISGKLLNKHGNERGQDVS